MLTSPFLLLPSSRRGKNPAVNKNVFRENPEAGSLGRQVTLQPDETKNTQEGKDKKGEKQESWNTPVISALSRTETGGLRVCDQAGPLSETQSEE